MSCFRCFRQRKRRVKLMFVGLDGAGKSTLLQTIVGDPEDFEPTVPTVGFHNVVLPSKRAFVPGFQVEVFDLGGGKRIRGIWQAYVSDVHAVVFVVDAADTARLDEARTVFQETLKDPRLHGKPVAVFANKQDLVGAKSGTEIATALGLDSLQDDRFRVVGCAALRRGDKDKIVLATDSGVGSAMRWLLGKIGEDWEVLSKKVTTESAAFAEKENNAKQQRLEAGRVAKQERLLAEEKEHAEKKESKTGGGKAVILLGKVYPLPQSPPISQTPGKQTENKKVVPGAFGSPVDDAPPPGGAWTPAPPDV